MLQKGDLPMSLNEDMQRIEEIRKQAEEVTVAAVNVLYDIFKATPPDSRKWILNYLMKVDSELKEQGQ